MEAQKRSWFVVRIKLQTSGKAWIEQYPPKCPVLDVKAYHLKLLTPPQPIATANAKDGGTRSLSSVIYTASEREAAPVHSHHN